MQDSTLQTIDEIMKMTIDHEIVPEVLAGERSHLSMYIYGKEGKYTFWPYIEGPNKLEYSFIIETSLRGFVNPSPRVIRKEMCVQLRDEVRRVRKRFEDNKGTNTARDINRMACLKMRDAGLELDSWLRRGKELHDVPTVSRIEEVRDWLMAWSEDDQLEELVEEDRTVIAETLDRTASKLDAMAMQD